MKPFFRNLLVLPVIFLSLLGGGCAYLPTGSSNQVAASALTHPGAALNELRRGNTRYVNSHRTRSTDTRHDADQRHLTAKGQHPFTAVLGCSDSRVCPEFIFDQQPGNIFEVRNAGNVVDEDVLASLEYAVEHLHVPLVVVLGHKGCGAIDAVCAAGSDRLPHHLHAFQDHMQGIRQQVLRAGHRHDAEMVNRMALENARQQALTLPAEIPSLKEAIDQGKVQLVYGIYDMETGEVALSNLSGSGSGPALAHQF